MKIPISWLRDYVDVDLPVEELAHRLTMAGVEAGEIHRIGDWGECLVGQVIAVQPHPQADRLRLCQVNTGSEEVEVVCGALNVDAGQKICFARPGARLFNAHTGTRGAPEAGPHPRRDVPGHDLFRAGVAPGR